MGANPPPPKKIFLKIRGGPSKIQGGLRPPQPPPPVWRPWSI